MELIYEYFNKMILNDNDIGISMIELDKDILYIIDKDHKYRLSIYISKSNWKEINKAKIGEKCNIDFNEYCLSENNESALIWATEGYILKKSKDIIIFNFKFTDFSDICYMNKRGCFDIKPYSLEVRVLINYQHFDGESIKYIFD